MIFFTVCMMFLYSPTSDGSAAAIVCSEGFVKRHKLEGQAVEILAIAMATDLPSTFNEESCMKMVSEYAYIMCVCTYVYLLVIA